MTFLKKIFLPICLIASLLILIYTFYKSEIYWNGKKSDYYFTYYVVSFLLIFFSFITFFLSQKIKEYLIISGISLIVSLYVFEGYLTFKEQLSKEQVSKNQLLKERLYEKETSEKYDTRTKKEVYEDLKRVNNEISVFVPPASYLNENYPIFPLSSISNSETVFCNENGYYPIYQSDRYGFNNPDEEWNNKEIEYLLVGDSYAQGACVNRPNDIASVLRALSNKSALNLGYGGNGPLIEYATLREYFNSNVKKVLWIYYEGNDLEDLDFEIRNKILRNYLDDLAFTQNLKIKQSEIDKLVKSIVEKEMEKIKVDLISIIKLNKTRLQLSLYLPSKNQPQPSQTQLELKKILRLANNFTIKNDSKLYFVYLPSYGHYKVNYKVDYKINYNLIKKIVNELNIPFIDINREVFEKERNPLKLFPFEMPGHYNVEGYKKVADTIYKFTKD